MITRRLCLAAGPAALLAGSALAAQKGGDTVFDAASDFPHKDAFAAFESSYLNCASQHPVSLGARAAANRYFDYKSFSADTGYSNLGTYYSVLEKYAAMINADPDDVAFVQSTTVGENLILKALDIPGSGGRIVTDELHYVGSLPTYAQIAEQGTDVVTLRANTSGRIEFEQFESAIDRNTRLVSISLVSMVNGFQHDLKEICRIAHARGAYVYADVVHAVGGIPFDVQESGVDFCSSASYKWLMGEQGLGFLYARGDRLEEIHRPWFGHYQLDRRTDLGFPSPESGATVTRFEHVDGARGFFGMGSQANIVAAVLDHSLDYLQSAGVERIQAYRQPLIDRLQESLPSLGFPSITPRDSSSALVSFRHDGNTDALRSKLHEAGITITVAPYHLRISPSVFNDMDDIEGLISALA